MRTYWGRAGPKSNDWCPDKKDMEDTEMYMQRKGGHVKTKEAEMGGIHPQAPRGTKVRQQSPEATTRQGRISL